MALTPEQKALVQQKAKEKIAAGISTEAAVKAAFDEVAGPTAFEETKAAKDATLREKAAKSEQEIADQRNLQEQFTKEQVDWTNRRTEELKLVGYGEAEANSVARKEFNDAFGVMPPSGFGTFEERKASLPPFLQPADQTIKEPSLLDVIRPQVLRGSPLGIQEGLEAKPLITPSSSLIPIGIGPDWASLKKDLRNRGLSEEEASFQVSSLRDIYTDKLQENKVAVRKKLNTSLEGLLSPEQYQKAILAGYVPLAEQASRNAYEQTISEISDIDKRLQDKSTYIKDEDALKKFKEESKLSDPLFDAFQKTFKPGEGVPNLTPSQIKFLAASFDKDKREEIERLKKTNPKGNFIIKKDKYGNIISREYVKGDYPADTLPEEKAELPLTDKEIENTLLKESFKTPWWADPTKRDKVLQNPEAYSKGILTKETPFGGQTETTTGWLIRGALAIPNAVAGLASRVLEGTPEKFDVPLIGEIPGTLDVPFVGEIGGSGEAIAEEKRRRRPEMYKDSPILYNIKENRGFFGEAQEVADILKLTGPEKYVYLSGAFAADMLDPSLDAGKAVVTGAKAGIQAKRTADAASRAIGAISKSNILPASKVAAISAANDFIDSSFLSSLNNVILKKPLYAAGDPRAVAIGDLTSSLSASQKVSDDIAFNANITAREAADSLKVTKDRTSSYAQEFIKKADAAPNSTAKQIYDDLKASAGSTADNMIQKSEDISVGLKQLADEGSTRLLRTKEVARQLGALASIDPSVQTVLRAVDAAPATGKTKLSRYIGALEPAQLSRLKLGLAYDAASTYIYKQTKDMSNLDNLVALTKNTYVDKASVPKIMEKAKASEIVKMAEELGKGKVSFKAPSTGTFGRKIVQAFDVTPVQADAITKIAEDLNTYRKLDNNSLINITSSVQKGGFISTEDLRQLIDANLDLIAEASVVGTTEKLGRARDIARLPVSKQLDILVPLENRAFSRSFMKELYNKLFGKYTRTPSKLSIGQQQLLQEATQRASSLDIKLRSVMQDLVGEGPSSVNARQAYGVADPTKPLSKSDALAYAIVGPPSFGGMKNIKSVLEFAINNLFYNKGLKQDIFNLFSGVNIDRATGSLTAKALDELEILSLQAAQRISDDPQTLWKELADIRRYFADQLTGPDRQLYFNNPDEVIDVVTSARKIPQEVSLSLFYKAEANRITDELLSDLVNKEIGKGQVTLDSTISEDYFNFVKSVESRLGLKILDNYPAIISNRLKKILTDPNWKTSPISESDIDDIFPNLSTLSFYSPQYLKNMPMTAKQIMKDTEFMSVVSTIFEMAEDIALGIKRQNGLSDPASISAIEDTIKSITRGEGGEAAQLKLLFGEDVAGQIKDSLSEGFKSLKEDLQKELVKNYEGKGLAETTMETISNLADMIQEFRYTVLLNLRPRFHGANLVTAADIYYQTTGKLPNYLDVGEGLLLTHTSRNNPNKIVLRSSTLRGSVSPKFYTAREVYDLLAMQGGKSVYTLTAPTLANKRALNLTDDEYSKFKEAWFSFGNAPTIEDMGFRYAVFADAIRAGRSEQEAVALARKAMFDAADITSVERSVQKLLMFYGFARNNFVNFAKNMASVEGRRRIRKFLTAKRNTEGMFTTDQEREFAPGYIQTKLIVDKIPFGEKEVYITSPSLATTEAIKLFGEFIKGNYGEVLSGMVNPTYKEILGMQSTMDKDPAKVPPEHAAFLKAISNVYGVVPEDIISILVGSEVVPRKAKPEEGAVGGLIYPLTTPEQIKRYKTFIDLLNFTGLSAPINDWSKAIFGGEGTAVQPLSKAQMLAYAGGAITPSAALPAWRQDYFNKLSKMKAIQESAAKMKAAEKKEQEVVKEALPATTMSAKAEERKVKEQQQKYKPAKTAGITETATFKQADAAYKAKKAEALRARSPEERKRLQAEAKVLFDKAKALKAANK